MKIVLKNLAKNIPVVVYFAIPLIVFGAFSAKRIYRYNQEGSELMTQLFEMKTLLSAKEVWNRRADWIGKEIPRFDTRISASQSLLNRLGHSLSDHGLALSNHKLGIREEGNSLSPEELQKFDRASIEITIEGEERDIVEWIHKIQSEGNFTGVDSLSLELNDYGLECRLEVSQWYLGNNRSLNLSEHHQAEVHDLDSGLVDSF